MYSVGNKMQPVIKIAMVFIYSAVGILFFCEPSVFPGLIAVALVCFGAGLAIGYYSKIGP
jgi:hypothetical protein